MTPAPDIHLRSRIILGITSLVLVSFGSYRLHRRGEGSAQAVQHPGQRLYSIHCQQCHGTQAEGGTGPNLTDNLWIHGGSDQDIVNMIHDGMVGNGMPAWGEILDKAAIETIAAYIISIRDTNIPGKAPEGSPYP